MTRRKLWMLGVLGGATLLVLAVLAVSWDRFHGWLDGTAPLAEWLVAGGTFILALATFRLAQQTAEEAKQVKLEASAVTKQVELQSEQAAAAVRPVVYPIANEEWTKTRRSTLLMVRNGGAGPAVSVKGKIFWQRGGGSEAETKVWESGSLGAGEVRWFRLAKPGVDDWNNARGELNFTDLNDEKWQTYFESTIEDGDIVVVRVVAINRLIWLPEWQRGSVLTFNNLLHIEGIDPRRVRLVKHQDTRARTPSLYEVWRSDPKRLERYQEVQSREVFKVGEILASFVVTPNPRRETLFIGLYSVKAVGRARDGSRDPILGHEVGGMYRFTIGRRLDGLSEYVGRLTIDWGASHRAWHQRAIRQNKTVTAIRDEIDPPFPGFDKFAWDIARMDDMPPNWKEHLRHVKGVYLLVDTESGARYVGSATGGESLWGRFKEYLDTGHGGNIELRRLGKRQYRASVLQIGSFDDEILALERAWKRKLMTREFGLNGN